MMAHIKVYWHSWEHYLYSTVCQKHRCHPQLATELEFLLLALAEKCCMLMNTAAGSLESCHQRSHPPVWCSGYLRQKIIMWPHSDRGTQRNEALQVDEYCSLGAYPLPTSACYLQKEHLLEGKQNKFESAAHSQRTGRSWSTLSQNRKEKNKSVTTSPNLSQ